MDMGRNHLQRGGGQIPETTQAQQALWVLGFAKIGREMSSPKLKDDLSCVINTRGLESPCAEIPCLLGPIFELLRTFFVQKHRFFLAFSHSQGLGFNLDLLD